MYLPLFLFCQVQVHFFYYVQKNSMGSKSHSHLGDIPCYSRVFSREMNVQVTEQGFIITCPSGLRSLYEWRYFNEPVDVKKHVEEDLEKSSFTVNGASYPCIHVNEETCTFACFVGQEDNCYEHEKIWEVTVPREVGINILREGSKIWWCCEDEASDE